MKKGTVNGYKLCYKEEGAKDYIRHYMTYTHKQAKKMLMYYKRYPQASRKDNHPLVKPKWVIIPIKKSEIICTRICTVSFFKIYFCTQKQRFAHTSESLHTKMQVSSTEINNNFLQLIYYPKQTIYAIYICLPFGFGW